MPANVLRRRQAALTALAVAAAFLSGPARAGDKPATSDGAQKIQALLDSFLPAAPAGSPRLVTVKPDGQNYLVSTDLTAFNGLLKSGGSPVSYDPATIIYKLFEQADGNWRIVLDALPKIVSRAKDATSTVEIDNYHQTLVISPALAWWLSGSATADKGALTLQAPKVEETFEFGPVKSDFATTVNPDGSVSSTVKDELTNVEFKASATDKDGKTVASSGRLGKAAFNIGVDRLKSRKLFDVLTFVSAHRADLAQHEVEFKELLTPLAEPGLKFVEGGEASKLMVASPVGAISLSGAKVAIGIANAGTDSAIDLAVAADGLSLPVGLAPPGAADLTPSRIDLSATLKGIDISAAAKQAISVLHLEGPGPVISDVDAAKVSAALLGAGPLRIVVAPSHVAAPAIDADLQGEMRYAAGKPSGSMTVRMRSFEKTMAAIKGLGPDVATKTLPAFAMAKGLAKTESDGSLSWVVEVGDDRSIKVNGFPLGKAPAPPAAPQ
jgi:hypothetical protein